MSRNSSGHRYYLDDSYSAGLGSTSRKQEVEEALPFVSRRDRNEGSTAVTSLAAGYQERPRKPTGGFSGKEIERSRMKQLTPTTLNISRFDDYILQQRKAAVHGAGNAGNSSNGHHSHMTETTWHYDQTVNAFASSPRIGKNFVSNGYVAGYHRPNNSSPAGIEGSKVTARQNDASYADSHSALMLGKQNCWSLTPYQSEFLEQSRSNGQMMSMFPSTCQTIQSPPLIRNGHHSTDVDVNETVKESGYFSTTAERLDIRSDVESLTREELIMQCHLIDFQRKQSESHEREMGEQLTASEDQLKHVKGENIKLSETIKQLESQKREMSEQLTDKENQLKCVEGENKKLREIITRQSQWLEMRESSKLRVESPDAHLLRLVTILFTCQLKDFFVHQIIDQGCEGAVFLVQCNRRGLGMFQKTLFALKAVFNIFGHSTVSKLRNFYQNEYTSLCHMQPHKNIVRLYAFFYDRTDDNSALELPPAVAENARTLSLFLVMEHVPNTLKAVVDEMRRENRLTSLRVMKWARQIFAAIEHMLQYNVVHRDLKLDNVLVTREGILKICDFGSSILLLDSMTMRYQPGGSLGGNPAHMPPEILNAVAGQDVACQTQDLWASAVMVYEMAGGASPFARLDQKGYRVGDIPDLRLDCGDVRGGNAAFPRRFVELIRSLLEFDVAKRPNAQEAIAVTDELINCAD